MGAINPIKYTSPGGEELLLRWTLGAQRRIAVDFGTSNTRTILDKYGFSAVPRLVFHCCFDEQGNPPAGMTIERFEESFPADEGAGVAVLAALVSATTQGAVTKNEAEARLVVEIEKSRNGLNSGASPANASGSPTGNSGTSIQPNSNPSPTDIPLSNGHLTTEPES